MRKISLSLFLALLAALLLSSCASQTVFLKKDYDFTRIKRVAVLPFNSSVFSNESGTMVSELFIKYLLRAGYNVVERAELDAIMKEYQLSQSSLYNSEQVKQFKLSGIDAIVTGTITKNLPEQNLYDNGYPRFIAAQAGITCRMIDVETGEILWAGADVYDGMTQQTAFDYLTSTIVNQLSSDMEKAMTK